LSYFRLERWAVNSFWDTEGDPETFQIFFASKGEAAFVWENGVEKLATGRTCMVPAALGAFEIRPIDEPAELLRVTIPA
jgi:mannose-6-phosphate isomerase class I